MNNIKISCFLVVVLFISGCAINRSSGKSITSKENAIIVGQVSEGYLTQPHGLYIRILSLDTSKKIMLRTKGHEDDIKSRNILGHKFMYEVPPGKYEIANWGYRHYRGMSKKLQKPIIFEAKAGEVSYIGNFHANALRFCLVNTDKFESEKNEIKTKYPILTDYKIQDEAKNIAFYNWGHDNSEAFSNFKVCDQPIKK